LNEEKKGGRKGGGMVLRLFLGVVIMGKKKEIDSNAIQ